MAAIIPFPEADYFGDCPRCYTNDGFLNVERTHWYVCHKHRVRWCVGANLFSGWHRETEEEWERNKALLATYAVIEPLHRWRPDRGMSPEATDIPF